MSLNRFKAVRIIASTLIFALSAIDIAAGSIFIETESFSETGGWKTDAQFIDIMGSPYLLAHGAGIPVEDASTEITFPEAGLYHVYARTYNWTSPWLNGDGPGAFRVSVGGVELPATLGNKGSGWEWQYAGSVKTDGLDTSVKLHDLSGFDGRCDALYFTTDKNDVPPSGGDTLKDFRSRLSGNRKAAEAGNFDLVVIGGGIAGMSAAATAARLGNKVALIQNRPVLGGNNSSEVRVHLGGCIDIGKYPALGGLQKEFGPLREGNAQVAEYYEDEKKLEWIKAQKGVELFLNVHVNEVEMAPDSSTIISVTGIYIPDGRRIRFTAPLFYDCTGDGTIGALAGADYLIGRESREEFGEASAPEKADAMTMGASVQWRSSDCASEIEAAFPEFEYGLEFNDNTCHRIDRGEWTWETGMHSDQLNDFERVRDYGMLVAYSNWSYIKNRLGLFPRKKLDWVAYVGGKRETRRLLGDYILKEDDLVKRVAHEDGSFTASWSIDLHFPDPENSRQFPNPSYDPTTPGGSFIASNRHVFIHPYTVPYRCLYSRNVSNLFMVGRNISCTHVALGTVRVMRTTGQMGEVVGMAASLCLRDNLLPRDIYHHRLPELKALMSKGVADPSLPNNQNYNEGHHLSD